jgi:DNA-binding XRE family transcriptional regulator
MPWDKAMGELLFQARRRADLTQEEVARQVQPRVTKSTISAYERGKIEPPEETKRQLAKILHQEVHTLHRSPGASGASDNLSQREYGQASSGIPNASPLPGETKTVAFAGGAMRPWFCPECGRSQDAARKFCPWDGTARPIEMGGPPLPLDPARPVVATGEQRAGILSDEEIARRVADLDDADAAAARPESTGHAAEDSDP